MSNGLIPQNYSRTMLMSKNDEPKILHVSLLPYISDGILQQLSLEQTAADKLEIPWKTIIFSNTPNPQAIGLGLQIQPDNCRLIPQVISSKKIFVALHLRRSLYKWLKEIEQNFDLILIRYPVHDPWLVNYIHRSKVKIGLIHHAIEEAELRSEGGIIGITRSWLENVIGPLILNKAHVLIGLTPEILTYQISRSKKLSNSFITYPNGGNSTETPSLDRRADQPELLFMASKFSAWHGLDRLLNAMRKDKSSFKLHLVGSLSGDELLRARQDRRVVIHGTLSREEIKQLSGPMWLGLSCFALERQGMMQACPLKTRDYLSMGIPVYGNHAEVFSSDFKFYKQGPVDVTEILQTAHVWRNVSREEVSSISIPLISKSTILRNFYESLKKIY